MKIYKIRQSIQLLLVSVLLLASMQAYSANQQKREFRGAWIQCVNGQFMGMGTRQMQETSIPYRPAGASPVSVLGSAGMDG